MATACRRVTLNCSVQGWYHTKLNWKFEAIYLLISLEIDCPANTYIQFDCDCTTNDRFNTLYFN